MIELFERIEGGLSPRRVGEIEAERGQVFPRDFSDYLMKVNGGLVRASKDFKVGDDYTSSVRGMFGFNGSKYQDIAFREALVRHYMPSFLMPVAEDMAGAELFVIDLRPETLGQVSLRAFNARPLSPPALLPELFDADNEEAAIYRPVCSSFTQLLRTIGGVRRRGHLA